VVDSVNAEPIISDTCKVLELDLTTMSPGDVEFSNQYSIKFAHDETCHAILAWFDCEFSRLTRPKTLSTSPYGPYTHWKQVVFYLEEEIRMEKGDKLRGSIACKKSPANFRELDIKISFHHVPADGHEGVSFVQ